MSSIPSAAIINAQNVLNKVAADLEAARGYPGCEALVAMLERRLADGQEVYALYERAASPFDAADEALREAKRELKRAEQAYAHGSADRAEALRLRDDLEVALQTLIVRTREREAARHGALGPLEDIASYQDDDRRSAESRTRAAVAVCLENFSVHDDAAAAGWDLPKMSDVECAWCPFFEARALAAYEEEAATTRAPRPIEALKAAFEFRARARSRVLETILARYSA